jgi:hypothetical protein
MNGLKLPQSRQPTDVEDNQCVDIPIEQAIQEDEKRDEEVAKDAMSFVD